MESVHTSKQESCHHLAVVGFAIGQGYGASLARIRWNVRYLYCPQCSKLLTPSIADAFKRAWDSVSADV